MLIANKSIAIIGGGPGGLTLARLLQQRNIDVKVYERDEHKDARPQGTTLDLHDESGLKALQVAGLMDAFKKYFRPGADKITIVDNNMHVYYDEHALAIEKDFGSEHYRPEIDRGPLRDLLIDSLLPNTIQWNKQFASLEKNNSAYIISFKDGSKAEADIVIGADGGNSKLRPYITSIKPFYTGYTAVEGHVENAIKNAPAISNILRGGKIFAMGNHQTIIVSAKGDGSLAFYTGNVADENWYKNELDFNNKKQVMEWFEKDYKSWDKQWNELFENAPDNFIPRPIYCMPLDQTWETKDGLTLIGDAAHLMPPYAGEGVNMAMLDALELSECLLSNDFRTLTSAIEFYEINMRKRASAIADESIKSMHTLHSENGISSMLQMFQHS